MNKTITFIIVALIIIGGAIWLWSANEEESVGIPEESQPAPGHEEAELTGFNFILDFIKIAPPQSDSEAENRVYDALSAKAKENVSRESIVRDMASFIGVQDVPDQGVSVEDLQIHGQKSATLIVGLNYSGGRIIRHIHLIVEDGQWKVDRVSIPEEKAYFDQIGNLARDNPGMEEGIWYLVYEEAGQPALTKALIFSQSSICAQGVENMTCDPENLSSGARVRILGEEEDESVRVIRLEYE